MNTDDGRLLALLAVGGLAAGAALLGHGSRCPGCGGSLAPLPDEDGDGEGFFYDGDDGSFNRTSSRRSSRRSQESDRVKRVFLRRSAVSETMFARRYTEPALFLLTPTQAKAVGERWTLIRNTTLVGLRQSGARAIGMISLSLDAWRWGLKELVNGATPESCGLDAAEEGPNSGSASKKKKKTSRRTSRKSRKPVRRRHDNLSEIPEFKPIAAAHIDKNTDKLDVSLLELNRLTARFILEAIGSFRVALLESAVGSFGAKTITLSEDAWKYGILKASFHRAKKESSAEIEASILEYAVDWQCKRLCATGVVPKKLIVPFGDSNDPDSLEQQIRQGHYEIRYVPSLAAEEREPRLALHCVPLTSGSAARKRLAPRTKRATLVAQPTETLSVIFGVDKKGALFWPYGLWDVNIFTLTSKMSAPSFSLPAGSPSLGGTCGAEGFETRAKGLVHGTEREDQGEHVADPIRAKICAVCYAMKGHYSYLSNVVPGLIRKCWIRQELDKEIETKAAPGALLGRQLAMAIDDFARHAATGGWSDDKTGRENLEIGVWNGSQLVAAHGAYLARGTLDPERRTIKPTLIGSTTTDALREAERIPNGAVAGFFRIHDSGDFSVLGGNRYIHAWGHVANMLPYVHFWAPTRIWTVGARRMDVAWDARTSTWVPASTVNTATSAAVSTGWESKASDWLAEEIAKAPRNLVVRPSAIVVGESPPLVVGIAAGTAVNEKIKEIDPKTGKVLVRYENVDPVIVVKQQNNALVKRRITVKQCPVYSTVFLVKRSVEQPDGSVKIEESVKEAKSCREAGCRVCWLRPEVPVAYGAH